MFRRTRAWQALAVLFVLVNVGGFAFAAVMREGSHAGLHLALAIVGVYIVRRSSWRRPTDREAATSVPAGAFGDRLTRLEQSLEAAALEVERIGEGQRFMTRLLAEDGAKTSMANLVREPSEPALRNPKPPAAQ